MNAVVDEIQPERTLHLPRKILGDNFYQYYYGVNRCLRVQAMAKARRKEGEERSELVKEARKLNRECVWALRRTTRKP